MKIWLSLKQKGIRYVIQAIARRVRVRTQTSLITPLSYHYYRHFKYRKTFCFQQKEYRYLCHRYNQTWKNERAVELPIVWSMLQPLRGRILEVGNVLSHYFTVDHDVVDKYEKAKGVINEDITEIRFSEKYDIILSISTLEHVGWDENPNHSELVKNANKILLALDRMRAILRSNGKIIITVPIGYNPYLDQLLRSKTLTFEKKYFMKRVAGKSTWVETSWNDIKEMSYDMRVPTANAIMIGIIENN